MEITKKKVNEFCARYSIAATVGLILLDRLWILKNFTSKFLDEDQAIMWLGTRYFSRFEFHEPRFYGQSYNSLLESLFAVPFDALGIPLNYSLPLVTLVLSLILPVSLVWCARKTIGRSEVIMMLLFILALPIEYEMIAGMPRGFVTGLALASIPTFLLIRSVNRKSVFTAGFLSVLSLSLNSNVAIYLLPLWLYSWLNNYRSVKLYVSAVAGFALGILVHYQSIHFYTLYPNYDLHKMWTLQFTMTDMLRGLNNLKRYWGEFSAIPEPRVTFYPLFFGAVLFALRKIDKNAFISVLLTFLFLIASLGINKVHDGIGHVFFPNQRAFLALPFIALLVFYWLCRRRQFSRRTQRYILVCLGLSFLFKVVTLESKRATITAGINGNGILTVLEVDKVFAICEEISGQLRHHKSTVVMFSDDRRILNYACPATVLIESGQESILAGYERRTWRLLDESRELRSSFLTYGLEGNIFPKKSVVNRVADIPAQYLVTITEPKSIISVGRSMGITFRNF